MFPSVGATATHSPLKVYLGAGQSEARLRADGRGNREHCLPATKLLTSRHLSSLTSGNIRGTARPGTPASMVLQAQGPRAQSTVLQGCGPHALAPGVTEETEARPIDSHLHRRL